MNVKNQVIGSISPAYFVPVLVLALAFLAACGGDDESTRTPEGTPLGSSADGAVLPVECTAGGGQRGLLADLAFDDDDGHFDEGVDIVMTLTLINCGDNEVRLFFPTTKRYEVSIRDEDGIEVWTSSDSGAFSPVTGSEVIATGGTVVYAETWEQEDSHGEQVPPGTYKVSALSVGCAREGASDCKFGPIRLLEIVE